MSSTISGTPLTARNLNKRSLGMRPLVPGLSKLRVWTASPAADVAASLAAALEELHRLQRSLDRRIRPTRDARMGLAPKPAISATVQRPQVGRFIRRPRPAI